MENKQGNQELVWVRFQIPKEIHRIIKSTAALSDVNLDTRLQALLIKGVEAENKK
jgi:transposase-like protein